MKNACPRIIINLSFKFLDHFGLRNDTDNGMRHGYFMSAPWWDVSSKFDSSQLDIFKRVKLMFQLVFFTSQIKFARELLVWMCIFIYFAHSFQQDYHEDDVEPVAFSRTCGGRQRIKYKFEFGCICIDDLVNLIHIVQSICLRKWSYMKIRSKDQAYFYIYLIIAFSTIRKKRIVDLC
jgi:hypothetical protein